MIFCTLRGYVAEAKGSFDRVGIFAKRNFKLAAAIGQDGAESISVYTLLDTRAGPNLIHE